MAQMNDEPAFPVDGTDFENLNNEDAKSLGYEVFVDDHTTYHGHTIEYNALNWSISRLRL